MKHSLFLYLLYVLHIFLGISATAGGGLLILKPDGSLLGMDPTWLNHSPFNNYIVPGILLFIMIGLFNLFTFVGLIMKPGWRWANALNIYTNRYWAWTYSLYSGIIVIAWITIQLIMTQYFWLQPVIIFTGLLMIILSITPSVMKKFEIQ